MFFCSRRKEKERPGKEVSSKLGRFKLEAELSCEHNVKFHKILMPFHHRGILSQERKTEWKCTYGELLSKTKCLQENEQKLSGLTQKRSNTSQDISNDCETLRKERQRVRFKESQSRDKAETPTCPTCHQIIANEAKDYSCFMEKSVGSELITMVVIIDINVVGKRCFVERGEL